MKTKIFIFLMGCLFIVSCSNDIINQDFDKSRYVPGTFYNTQDHAIQALNAAYSGLNDFGSGYSWTLGIMHFVLGDDLYETGYAAGFAPWGPIGSTWSGYYANILKCNVALEVMPQAQAQADNPNFTTDVLNLYMGQVYFLRAFNYYWLYTYFPDDKIVLRRTPPQSADDFTLAPSPSDSTFAFIESDLKKAESLLTSGLNITPGYEKGRVTRGAAAALLGKLYMYRHMYDKAAAEFKKILPDVGDAAYGTYSLVENYRDNFTKYNENNSESVFEIQYDNITQTSFGNELNWITQNWTLNHTSLSNMWWNFGVPTFKLDEFENWTEDIGGIPTTVYDYRVYETFWGVPHGANFTDHGTVKDWQAQGWADETIIGLPGAYGIRKMSLDNSEDYPTGANAQWSDRNIRIIRLADVMLLYAECMANLNPSNLTATDPNSAIYWIDKVRNRANNVMDDQPNLYSARPDIRGQLPPALNLMNSKGWSLMRLIEHERYVEGYCEGWRKEDLKRWKKGADYDIHKSFWNGYESLTLPVPASNELDRNPNMPQ